MPGIDLCLCPRNPACVSPSSVSVDRLNRTTLSWYSSETFPDTCRATMRDKTRGPAKSRPYGRNDIISQLCHDIMLQAQASEPAICIAGLHRESRIVADTARMEWTLCNPLEENTLSNHNDASGLSPQSSPARHRLLLLPISTEKARRHARRGRALDLESSDLASVSLLHGTVVL